MADARMEDAQMEDAEIYLSVVSFA